MKLPLLLAALFPTLAVAEKAVTLGDSLTFAYEAEFGFKITVPLMGTFGDGMPAHVRNWIEILGSPTYRGDRFDQGARKNIELRIPLTARRNLLFRHEYNWAIPGLKIDQLRRFILGEASFLALMAESEGFASLNTALGYSDFSESRDFNLAHLESQISGNTERLIFFIGGNDVRTIYGTVYHGGTAGNFADDFVADADAILSRVRQLNPDIQLVVVAVPHIGITPDIKTTWPYDAEKTARVTALLQDLNGRLKALAIDHDAGFADIFSPTLSLLHAAKWGVHGISYNNTGSATGDLGSLWLNGPLSANFHPNTQPQAVIANHIIEAFNTRYDTGIAPLSATEILGGLLGKSAAQIDMTFSAWTSGFNLPGLAQHDDSDGDGIPAALEFALGLDPTLHDGRHLRHRITGGAVPTFEIAYPRRLPASTRFTLTATTQTDLEGPFAPVIPQPTTAGPDGLLRAAIPLSNRGFLRLESTVSP